MNETINKLLKIIETCGYEGRMVGGIVRNYVLGIESITDIDIATNMPPNIGLIELEKHGLKCIPTGISHGTITVVLDNTVMEITTLRRDIKTDGRHAIVEYTDSWYEDSLRRDFTFNALYMDKDMNVYDYHNGIQDLHDKKIKFIGDPRTRIQEDYIRILRYYRFLSRYAKDFYDDETEQIMKEMLDGISIVSGERIFQEMIKLFASDNIYYCSNRVMWLMDKLFGINKNCFFNSAFENMFDFLTAEERFATLVAYNGEDALNNVITRLKPSRKFKRMCKTLLNIKKLDFDIDIATRRDKDMKKRYELMAKFI